MNSRISGGVIDKIVQRVNEQTFQRLLGVSSKDAKEWFRRMLAGTGHVLETTENGVRCLSCSAFWADKHTEELLEEDCPAAPVSGALPLRLISEVTEDSVQRLLAQIDRIVGQNLGRPALPSRGRPAQVTLWITSFGGDAASALGFHEAVRELQEQGALQLHTIAAGQCSSAALLLFLGGKARSITPHTVVVVHAPSVGEVDPNFSLPVEGEIEEFGRLFAQILSEATEGRVIEEMAKAMLEEGRVLSPEECVALGIAHTIEQ